MKASSSHRSATGMRNRRPAQAALPFRKPARDGSRRGGPRIGSGPKPQKGLRAPAHRKRPAHNANHPVHVTLRVAKDIPSLRRDDLFDWIRHSIAATNQSDCPRLGAQSFRIVEFSVQSNHIHLVIEAEDKKALSSGMTSLATRAARALNKALRRRGRVWAYRYYGRALTVPMDVRNTLIYVLMNHSKHQAKPAANLYRHSFGGDPCSSAPYFNGYADEADDEARWIYATRKPPPVHAPRTWLLSMGWRKHGLVKRAAT